ncbi:MAG: J domain-containing protein [Treponema sp.]|jgi:DnaJ-domain-containing protein 1|nr:J domain-containing protein [Treponema sp.]
MGIFDRLGDVLKNYLNDEDRRIFGRSRGSGVPPFGDPDLEAAYEELDELLGHGSAKRSGGRDWESPEPDGGTGAAWENPGASGRDKARNGGPGGRNAASPPEELRPDFAELGLSFGASAGECKAAYKKLLNVHHPDRHAGHAGNMKKATEKSARINAAYDRIEKWRKGKEE